MVVKNKHCKSNLADSCKSGFIYGLGFLGALVYYVSTAAGYWGFLFAIFKAVFWPAFIVYEVLRFVGA